MVNFEDDIIKSLEALQSSGLILYPTDTIWGIGCDATNELAIRKIYTLKKRAEKKSLIILVSDQDMMRNYVSDLPNKILDFLSSAERPTTAIFKNAIHLPSTLVNEDGSIAIRIVNDEFCQQLIRQLKKPVVSTSANISGEKFPQNFIEISDTIKKGVNYIVQHRQDDFSKKLPSSIIKIDEDEHIEIIR